MRALIRKELREHAAIAAAAFVITVLGLARANWDSVSAEAWRRIMQQDFLWVTRLGAGGLAFTLGVLQFYGEKRRGSWTFLVHGPIGRGRLLLAKATAALVVWGGAVLFPTMCAVVWFAWPGHVAGPFGATMLWPVAIDISLAVPFYFAGCVAGLWQPRWRYLRASPVGVMLSFSLLAFAVPEAWQAVGVLLAATAWFAVIAIQQVLERRGSAAQYRWMLIGTAAGALAGAHLLVVAFLLPTYPHAQHGASQSESAIVTETGEILIATYRGSLESLRTLDGESKPLPEARHARLNAPAQGLRGNFDATTSRSDYRHRTGFTRVAHPGNRYATEWFFDVGHGRFVAYDRATRERKGSLGPDGFSTDPSALTTGAHFHGEPIGPLDTSTPLLVLQSGAFRIDWAEPSVARVYAAEVDAVVDAGPLHRSDAPSWELLRTPTHVVWVGHDGRTVSLAVESDGDIETGLLDGEHRFYIRYNGVDTRAVFFDAEGNETKRVALPPTLQRSAHTNSEWRIALLPTCISLLIHVYKAGTPPLHLVWLILGGIASALAAFMVGRRHNVRDRLAFGAAGLLFGPIALALPALFVSEQRVACPDCGALRDTSNTRCPNCDRQLPGHRESDTQIIEPALMPADASPADA